MIDIAGRTFRGSGTSVSATWDGGSGADGKMVSPGNYTATLTANVPGGTCSDSRSATVTIEGCTSSEVDLSIDKSTLNPSLGERIEIRGGLKTPPPCSSRIQWNVDVSGSGVLLHFDNNNGEEMPVRWNGKDSQNNRVKPGIYTVTLSVATEDGCHGSKSAEVTVEESSSCALNTTLGSTANVTNGELSHDQELFSLKGSGMLTSVSLYYKSLDFKSGVLGKGWSHNYEAKLQFNSDGSIVLTDGARAARLYKLSGSTYASQSGDYSTLAKNADGTYVITERNGLLHNFDATGKINSRTDKNGNTATFAYTGNSLTGITDSAGRIVTFGYDANNRLTAITDPKGNAYTFAYTANDLLTTTTNPDSGQWSYTYDADGFLLTKTDPGGNTTTYTYDSNHRVLSGTDPQGQARSLVYPGETINATRSTTFSEKDGGAWTYTYDTSTGTLTSKTDPLGHTTSYTYDSRRNMLSRTEPVTGTTTYTYDTSDNMTSMTDPLDRTTTYTYNSFGQILTETGPQGMTTNTYDANGNLTSTTDPAAATTTYEYDAKGNITKITNAKNQSTAFVYDKAGLLASTTDPTGATTTYIYDDNGNLLTQTDATGKTSYFDYDSMNRLTVTSDPLGNATTYSYDRLGNRISQTDANTNITTFKYNHQGQITESKDPLDNTTTYTYGAAGCTTCGGGVDKLTGLTDAKNQTTTFTYDQAGRLLTEIDPLNKTTTYAYDAAGNLITKSDANGAAITYTYDALKRLTTKTYPGGATETYTYDTAGRINTATNSDVTYTYAYDAGSRVTSVTDSRGYAIAYEYDLLGNRTKMTLQKDTADQRITTYTYDSGNRLQSITSPAGVFTYSYDTPGRKNSLSYPNQTTAAYTYDSAGRLTSLTHHAQGGATIATYAYTHDSVGNRLTKSGTITENYTYDAIYRLTQAITPQGIERYTYDGVGNRLSGPGPKDIGYQYNAGNQMTKGRQFAYLYDDNGNQTTRSIPNVTDKSWTQEWDYENRLVKLEKTKGSDKQTLTFRYDPMGRRIEKKETTIKGGVTRISTWTYVYDNDNIAMEIYTDPNGATEKTFYTDGPSVDEHLALERGGQFYYYHADGLGSVTNIIDNSRNLVQSYTYDSFGSVRPATNFRNSYTYTGREWDKETGLYHYRARYYDPMEGRFLSEDPIGFKGGINLYAYVQNSPINFTDPLGLWQYLPGSGNNWCGPNWTGGRNESFTQGHIYDPPSNGLDSCCMAHDICYSECRKNNPCDLIDRDQCMTKCDRKLAICAASTGHKFSSPLWWWMNFNSTPDPDPDAPSCSAK